ncbi:uncharacterized protein LOC126827250 [Patella vulgata]|uniref:uncharacterized protein LOC126827250 n=1 Tax=Patella vulgata TaxID=6465 RepID=UPI0021806D0A|nr:uncharacterized protein LOC126827250 [Patella vulgata]XP_050412469.1 uncharacterized protein LOC126827250 [Patella vulgata]XP_050412470.1 uncharacterized protein LOC126827250 [Patella vulgata]
MAFRIWIRKKITSKKCLGVLILLYVIASSLLFTNFNKNISKALERQDYVKLHQLPAKYGVGYVSPAIIDVLTGAFQPCSSENSQFHGQKNYVCKWLDDRYSDSTGNYVMYAREFALLNDVIVDPGQATGRVGGENITSVLNQEESVEYLKLNKSYFQLNCEKLQHPPFNGKNHLNDWLGSVTCVSRDNLKHGRQVSGLTIAVQRYEYVNFYHTMTDYFNAFLIMILFQKSPKDINILYIDAHPAGSLDATWDHLFNKTYRAGSLATTTKFSKMAWNIQSYNSPLNNHGLPYVPYLEEFRKFFLSRHKADKLKILDCKNLSVLFIWRRDYVAHPRNPSGVVSRKIKNEDELLTSIKDVLPGHDIKALQLDKLKMDKQLELISGTDILIGMHGAGLTHTLFLPKHGGLIELYPTYWPQANKHFLTMARWRNLHYLAWKNHDPENEHANKMTYIPPRTLVKMVKEMVKKICNK